MYRRSCMLRSESSDDVGSSRMSSRRLGSLAARAISTICRCPMGRSPTRAWTSMPASGKTRSMLRRARRP